MQSSWHLICCGAKEREESEFRGVGRMVASLIEVYLRAHSVVWRSDTDFCVDFKYSGSPGSVNPYHLPSEKLVLSIRRVQGHQS